MCYGSKSSFVAGNVQNLHVFSSLLVPLRRGGAMNNIKVGISLFFVIINN